MREIDDFTLIERLGCVLLLDTCYGMAGRPIEELNAGLQTLRTELLRDGAARSRFEIAIVTFGPVSLVQDFVTVDNFHPPTLTASGESPMADAVEYGIEIIERRKMAYRESQIVYQRPWVMLITCRGCDRGSNWPRLVQRVHASSLDKKLLFFAIGVRSADMHTLAEIAPPQMPPKKLVENRYSDLFKWVSASAEEVTRNGRRGAIQLPSVNSWAEQSPSAANQ